MLSTKPILIPLNFVLFGPNTDTAAGVAVDTGETLMPSIRRLTSPQQHSSAPNLLSVEDHEALLANGASTAAGAEIDPAPVVKLFTPDAAATWLLTEIDPSDPDRAFGLCDLGLGEPELGYVSLADLAALRGRHGLPVERDVAFIPDRPISAYAATARATGRIKA